MKRFLISLIIFNLFSGSSFATSTRDDKKNKILTQLSSSSEIVDIYVLQSVKPYLTSEELDIVLFRLKKELEKVPDFDLKKTNSYDFRLIYNLIQIVHSKGTADHLAATNAIRNLANKKIYMFPLYLELLSYQLDSAVLRMNYYLTSDKKTRSRIETNMSVMDGAIQSFKANELPQINLELVEAHRSEFGPTSCNRLF